MDSWTPFRLATPTEWEIRYAVEANPIGIIRRFDFGDPRNPDTWYRAVTWGHTSAARQLIGYTRTPEAAAQAIWDSYLECNSSVPSRPPDAESPVDKPAHAAPKYLERED